MTHRASPSLSRFGPDPAHHHTGPRHVMAATQGLTQDRSRSRSKVQNLPCKTAGIHTSRRAIYPSFSARQDRIEIVVKLRSGVFTRSAYATSPRIHLPLESDCVDLDLTLCRKADDGGMSGDGGFR
jgi:hypothetical protein